MSKIKILVVDDEKFLVELMKTRLESDGFEVMTAFNGEEALEVVSRSKPDIILLDILMPGIDGWEVCRRIKGDVHLKDIPVIILTAKDQIVDRIEGMKCGAEDYVTKPYDPQTLLIKIQRQLRNKEKDE